MAADMVPRSPGYVSVVSRRYNEWQTLAYEARNDRFKQLFRTEDFRKLLVALLVDEAHVIAQWAELFRRDYGELSQLRVITGTEIPWGLVSATFPSQVFNLCFKSVHVGEN